MNFNFYILGTPNGRYSQYPNDYTVPVFSELVSNVKGTRLVIYRNLDLMHYIYAEQIDSKNYIGVGLIFNKTYIGHPRALLAFLRKVVEEYLVYSGEIIRYSETGKLFFNVRFLDDKKHEIDLLRSYINDELTNNEIRYGFSELSQSYSGIRNAVSISSSSTDDQILHQTRTYNIVNINSNVGIENGYVHNIIQSLKKQYSESEEKNRELQDNLKKLDRQKNQYKIVGVLLGVILLSIVVFLMVSMSLNRTISERESRISSLNDEVRTTQGILTDKEGQIFVMDSELKTLRDSLDGVISSNNAIRQEFSAFKSKISKSFPLIVNSVELTTSKSYGNTDVKMRINYNGLIAGKKVNLKIKLFMASGAQINETHSFNVSYGDNSWYFSCFEEKNYWQSGSYRCEIWYNDVCLKEKKFTIY